MLASAVVAGTLAACAAPGPGTIGAYLDDVLPAGSSGTLVAATDDGTVVCRGWGDADRERGVAADCDTVYDVMSMTKQFTAAAIVRLEQDGRLSTTDTLAQHLPGVPPDKRGITIRQLLTHTSGLPDTVGEDDERLTRDAFLDRALAADPVTPPGEGYLYSNVGYGVLAAVVETASGTGYETYLAEHLFAPAGMTSTGYVLPDWSGREVAVEYDADGEPAGTPLDHPWLDDGPGWNLRGNGGLLSTARDMARWHRALGTDRVLDADARRELFAPRVREEPEDSRYAYGWVVDEIGDGTALWHNGGDGRAYGETARDPDGSAAVFWVANQARSTAGGWDLEESGTDLTAGVLDRLRRAG